MQGTTQNHSAPHTAWAGQAQETQFVPKPRKPKQGKGTTKRDAHFDRMLAEDVAIRIPMDDFDAVRRGWDRYETNRGLKGQYSFRRELDVKLKAYVVWLEKRTP
jgi:hypothetical protein